MSDVWIVLIEDRHADVEALPFSSEADALGAAEDAAADNAGQSREVREVELNPTMLAEGWILLLEYGLEGDCVRVIRRPMDGKG